jgi:hypothetical protein
MRMSDGTEVIYIGRGRHPKCEICNQADAIVCVPIGKLSEAPPGLDSSGPVMCYCVECFAKRGRAS